MSKLETNTIDTISGTTNLTIGSTNSSTVTFESGAATGHMNPAFSVTLGTTQNISSGSVTKINLNNEVLDTDNCYDNSSNYRFTPNKAGKYMFIAMCRIEGTGANANARILKNGTTASFSIASNSASTQETINNSVVLDMNGTSDYVELYAEQNTGSTKQVYGDNAGAGSTVFHGFRLGA
jgi:hypothetical protein